MHSKRSKHEMKRLVESAVAEACRFPRPGLWFCVDEIDVIGNLPERLQVWATLHFLPTGSPFCCGEPGCHLAIWQERSADIGDHLRRAMGLRQTVTVDFGERIAVNYHAGVEFNHGQALATGQSA
jgi:hypothetical protein